MEQLEIENDDSELEKIREYIYSFDLSYVTDRLINKCGWRKIDALQTEKYYRNFLFLNKMYGKMPPPEDVDQFFHEHILFTEKYFLDTQIIFQKYFHHTPIDPKKISLLDDANIQEQFNRYQELHKKVFGEYVFSTKSRYKNFMYPIIRKLLAD